MIINSFDFIWLFPLIFITYMTIVAVGRGRWHRASNIFLLIVSYSLFWFYNETLTLVLLAVTLTTYLGARAMKSFGKKKTLAVTIILLAVFPLLAFKYYNFINDNISLAMSGLGIDLSLPGLNYTIPLGISFFSLQALGYFLDVYSGKAEVEENIADYMLFVAFFPQIASGPISKASDLMPQIKRVRTFSYSQSVQGLKWLLWGMFIKVVVADRIGDHISGVLANSEAYTQTSVIFSVILYSVQIYCDFAGYSFMALGIGQLLGFDLINNFHRPYFASTVTEFWHRWHRSLSTWLKEHIYIPLGGSRCSLTRNSFNILITFLVSGLWHGANWSFVLWGGIHGTAQIIEKRTGLNRSSSRRILRAVQILTTFTIVTLAWVFFVQATPQQAVTTIRCMFTSEGTASIDWIIPLLLTATVILKDIGDELGIEALRPMHSRFTVVRWSTYIILAASIMIFAVYGERFIYSGF